MEKVFLIIIDGLGDRPVPELHRKTPLDVANTPNLDALAKQGISGVMNTIDIGVRPGSDTAHLALFGYDPQVYYTGRGPIETAGIGMDHKVGDICFRVNMGSIDENGVVIDRRAGRIDSTDEFSDVLNGIVINGITFITKPGTSYRLGMIMRGKGLSSKISDIDPHAIGKKLAVSQPLDNSSEAQFTADTLNTFSEIAVKKLAALPSNMKRKLENKLPANCLLIRGAGTYPSLPSFQEKYGLKAACIAGAGLYKGIGRLLGMDVITVPEATGKPNTNVSAKIHKAIAIMPDYDFIYIHIKGADSLGEDGDYNGKIRFIEKVDTALAPLVTLQNTLIVITADHSTPCTIKNHSADDVPLTISSTHVRDDDVEHYSERECAKGRLGHIKGMHLMPIIVDLMNLAEKFGA